MTDSRTLAEQVAELLPCEGFARAAVGDSLLSALCGEMSPDGLTLHCRVCRLHPAVLALVERCVAEERAERDALRAQLANMEANTSRESTAASSMQAAPVDCDHWLGQVVGGMECTKCGHFIAAPVPPERELQPTQEGFKAFGWNSLNDGAPEFARVVCTMLSNLGIVAVQIRDLLTEVRDGLRKGK